jgi:hypothetical protein
VSCWVWYSIPFLPLSTQLVFIATGGSWMREHLPSEEQDREQHRSLILGMAGFSFTGLVALVVLDSTVQQNLELPIYCLFLSFLGYLSAMNLQSYKFFRWIDHVSDGLRDTAGFSLVLAVVQVVSRELWELT